MSAFKVWIHGTINCLGSPCWLHPVKSRWNLKITQLIPGKSFESNLRSWGSSLLTFSGCIGVGMGGFPPGRNCVGWKYHRVGVRGWQEMLDVGCWMMTDDDGCWWCWWWWRWDQRAQWHREKRLDFCWQVSIPENWQTWHVCMTFTCQMIPVVYLTVRVSLPRERNESKWNGLEVF